MSSNPAQQPPSPTTKQDAPTGKARSQMACTLCRRQKMKCEGPNFAPCKRCRNAKVPCVFEAPTQARRPQTEPWVESRIQQLEERLDEVEKSNSGSSTTVATKSADHERRIARLEAQLASLTLPQLPPLKQEPFPYPQQYHAPPASEMFHAQQSFQRSDPSLIGNYPQTMSYLSTPDFDAYSSSGSKRAGEDLNRVDKRWKVQPEEFNYHVSDFITQGSVSYEDASMCFNSYFFSLNHSSPNLGYRNPSLDECREKCPLLAACIVFIGARTILHYETAKICHDQVLKRIRLALLTPVSTLEAKAMLLFSLHTGLPDLLTCSAHLLTRHGAASALLDYDDLAPEKKSSREGFNLVQNGRAFLINYLWSNHYSYSLFELGTFNIPTEVIQRQLEILEASEWAILPADQSIRHLIELSCISGHYARLLSRTQHVKPLTYSQQVTWVLESLEEMHQWVGKWQTAMDLMALWGETTELRSAVPIHQARLQIFISLFKTYDVTMVEIPHMRRLGQLATESCFAIFQWGLESRWIPHSMSAQFLHQVSVPRALKVLLVVTKLFPQDVDHALIQNYMTSLLKACNHIIHSPPSGPEGEITQAHHIRELIAALDPETMNTVGFAGIEADNLMSPEEMTKCLTSLAHELKLYGTILLDINQ